MAMGPGTKRGKSQLSNHLNTLQNDSKCSVVKARFAALTRGAQTIEMWRIFIMRVEGVPTQVSCASHNAAESAQRRSHVYFRLLAAGCYESANQSSLIELEELLASSVELAIELFSRKR